MIIYLVLGILFFYILFNLVMYSMFKLHIPLFNNLKDYYKMIWKSKFLFAVHIVICIGSFVMSYWFYLLSVKQ